jgi:hypothetical protein
MSLFDTIQEKISALKDSRKNLDQIWTDIKSNYDKELPSGIIYHLGETERLVDSYTRLLFSQYLNRPKFFNVPPQNKPNIPTALAIDKALNFYFPKWLKKSHLEDVDFNGSLYGTAFGQVFPIEHKIRSINPENVWFNDKISDWDELDEIYVEYIQMRIKNLLTTYELTEEIHTALSKYTENEQGKMFCFIGEYWYKEEEKIYCQKILNLSGEYFALEEAKVKEYWMGMGFLRFVMYKRRNSMWGKSVGEKIKESELISNKLFNMTAQYAAKFTNPSMWYVPNINMSSDQMNNIREGKQSGIFPVQGNSIGYIFPPQLPMSVFNILSMFTSRIEQTGELLGVNLGYPGPSREPEQSRQARADLASQPIEYLREKFEDSFIQKAGEKVFLSMFQYFSKKDKEDFIEVTGKEWLTIKKGNKTEYKDNVLTISSSKEDFLEYQEDITIEPYRGQDVEMLKGLVNFLNSNSNELIKASLNSKIDFDKLVLEVLDQFGVKIESILKEKEITLPPPMIPLGNKPSSPMGQLPIGQQVI